MPVPNGLRTRTHPRVRFAPDEAEFDLELATEALMAEPQWLHCGHRQTALFRHGPMTLALYIFEAGSTLPNHVVDGPIIIHVIDGEVSVRAAGVVHHLSVGTLLRLSPRVAHDITANRDSRLLLTFCIEGPASHRS